MMAKPRLVSVLLVLSCAASAQVVRPPQPPSPEVIAHRAAEALRAQEDRLRLSVYFQCGGDNELRCRQFAPQNYLGFPPTIPVRALKCADTRTKFTEIRKCTFILGRVGKPEANCSISFHEETAIEGRYWSDDILEPPSQSGEPDNGLPRPLPHRSSLNCSAALLSLTEEPEKVDRAPATLPRLTEESSIAISNARSQVYTGAFKGPIAMILRVGSNGAIDYCTITQSSRVGDVDMTICRFLQRKARFKPALDRIGRAVAAEISFVYTVR